MIRYLSCAAGLLIALSATVPAAGATSAYMTGSLNPYGLDVDDPGSPEAAMRTNWGTDYDRFQGFDPAVFSAGYAFIYIEGSDVASAEFTAFMTRSRPALERYILDGGRAFINAARTDGSGAPLDVGFGITFAPGDLSLATPTGFIDEESDLASDGAGTSWTGVADQFFAHEVIVGAEVNEVFGSSGTVFGWSYRYPDGDIWDGYLFWGTQTAPAFHSAGGIQLRVNQLCRAGGGIGCDGIAIPVPEPGSWALMIAGFGIVGAALRRRQVDLESRLS